jgi:hypothetical protein
VNIPLGLRTKNANYPVLRVFASWPGEARLDRFDTWNTTSTADPDKHPLATLQLAKFKKVGEELDQRWFQGHVESDIVVQLKHAREEELDCIAWRAAKRRRGLQPAS